MKNLHLTTAPRLAMTRNANGELVPSIDSKTGEQDINVAGKLLTIKPQPITYHREDGTEGVAYQGTSAIVDDKGDEAVVSVLINGSAIEEVQVGQVYWLTERLSKDGLYSNYSQGSLLVMTAIDASVAKNRRAKLLASMEKVEADLAIEA
jgi:hypothetical protein